VKNADVRVDKHARTLQSTNVKASVKGVASTAAVYLLLTNTMSPRPDFAT